MKLTEAFKDQFLPSKRRRFPFVRWIQRLYFIIGADIPELHISCDVRQESIALSLSLGWVLMARLESKTTQINSMCIPVNNEKLWTLHWKCLKNRLLHYYKRC